VSTGGIAGPFVAFLAGLLSFVSPCVLPMVPVYLMQLTGPSAVAAGTARARRLTLLHTCFFVAGFSAVFIALGASLGLLGYGLRDHQRLLAEVAGAAIIVMGLHLSGILPIPLLSRTYTVPLPGERKERKQHSLAFDFGRSSIVGAGFALGWTPCIGPVLGSILALAGAGSTVARGALLLLFYSLGLAVPFLAMGMAVGSLGPALKRLNRHLGTIELVSGVLLVGVGVLLFSGRLTMFNGYFDVFGVGSRGL
jgi:cytochrome c-type biogenesis protein